MDQVKIGKFIAEKRKQKKLTQSMLAEKLGITDRAVSKWERGLSLPDASIMFSLCEILSINLTQLLKGEEVMTENTKELENIVINLKQKEELKSKQLLKLEILLMIVAGFSFLALFALGFYFFYISKNTLLQNVCIIIGTFILVLSAFFGVWIEAIAGYYKCSNCGHTYIPTYKHTLFAVHNGRSRALKCPECGKRCFHKKVISKDN